MQQQINLYRALPQATQETLSPLLMLQICNTLIVLLLIVWIGGIFYNTLLEGKILYLKEQQKRAAAELANITTKYPRAFKNAKIRQENQVLMQTIAQKKQLLQHLSASSSNTQYTGFSKYLLALTQTIVPGVWLKEITILHSGNEILFTGTATNPPAIMQFLQNLSKEPSFAGKKFKLLSMSNSEQQVGQIDFIITTQSTLPSATQKATS